MDTLTTHVSQEMANSTPDEANRTSSLVSAQLPLEKILSMSRGEGQDSYSKNSELQRSFTEFVFPDLDETLDQVILPAQGPVVVADLGCSSSSNTIVAVNHIVGRLKARFPDPASSPTEFQIFFTDLPSNDFNNLFHLLSGGNRDNFFAAGSPGSFYGRLFPQSSVHVFYSAFALHWLSKIPDEIIDKNSPAFNKGRLWVNYSNLATSEAYREQASLDLKNFLNARAAELVPGGVLFFVVAGRSRDEPSKPSSSSNIKIGHECVEEAWNDLISEGILTEEQRDMCNVPSYPRTLEEVIEDVESCGSVFHVLITKRNAPDGSVERLFSTHEPAEECRKFCGFWKGILTELFAYNIGKEATKVLWQRFDRAMEKNFLPKLLRGQLQPVSSDGFLVVALIRK